MFPSFAAEIFEPGLNDVFSLSDSEKPSQTISVKQVCLVWMILVMLLLLLLLLQLIVVVAAAMLMVVVVVMVVSFATSRSNPTSRWCNSTSRASVNSERYIPGMRLCVNRSRWRWNQGEDVWHR